MQLYDTMSNENPIEREKFSIKMEKCYGNTLSLASRDEYESDKKCRARQKKKKVVNLDSVTDRQTPQ